MKSLFLMLVLVVAGFGQGTTDWRMIKNKPLALASDYNYTPQTPNVTLTASQVATITMRPCPPGLVPTSTPLYLSGGTGTAEIVTPIGGTCTDNATSGTITFIPANSHSGSWTVQSASGGIQESLNNAGRVMLPCTSTTVRATIPVPAGATVEGCGATSVILPASSNLTIFSMYNGDYDEVDSGTVANVTFRDFKISGRAYLPSANTLRGIYANGQQYGLIDNVTFDEVDYGVFLDKVQSFKVSNIQLVDNSTIYVGSTSSSQTYPLSANNILTAITHKQTDETNSILQDGKSVIIVEGAIATGITNFNAQNLAGQMIGITVGGHCEGTHIVAPHIVMPKIGVQFVRSTVDGLTATPSYSKITGGAIDMYRQWAVLVDDYAFLTTIIGMELTGRVIPGAWGDEVGAIELRGLSRKTMIVDNYFASITDGDGVLVNAGAVDVMINNNMFVKDIDGPPGTASIHITSGTVNGLSVVHNSFDSTYAGANAFIWNLSTGTQILRDNLGIDNVKGVDITAASTIYVNRPFHYISGSATINNIDISTSLSAPGIYTGLITISAAAGSSWSFSTSGNIAGVCTGTAGKAFQIFYSVTDAKWIPVGCQ